LVVYAALVSGTLTELLLRVDMPESARPFALQYLHFYVMLQIKCKLAMPFGISDRYREGRENWLLTTDTCKKVMT
jgi:hypothetical protein